MLRYFILLLMSIWLNTFVRGQTNNFELYGGVNLMDPTGLRSSSTDYSIGMGFNFGGLYKTNKSPLTNTFIQIGLGFSQRTFSSRVFDLKSNSEISAENLIREIEVPLLINKEINIKKFQIIFRAGLVPGFNTMYRSKLKFVNSMNSSGDISTWEEVRTIRPYSFERLNLFAGIGFFRKFKNNQFGLQPNFQYNIMPVFKSNYLGPRFWGYGFTFHVRL